MGEAFIFRRGGTSSKVFAVIGVTYPSGATVTCTNGTKTLTAKDTTGTALFVIPSAGTWAVTAVNGSQSTSKSVSITTEGQVESVTLSFGIYLFNNGKISGYDFTLSHDNTTGSLTIGSTLAVYCGVYSWSLMRSQSKIDVSDYSTLTVAFKSRTGDVPSKADFGITSNTTLEGPTFLASKAFRSNATNQTLTLDITNVKASGYVAFHVGTEEDCDWNYSIESILLT